MVLAMIDTLESNRVPINKFCGDHSALAMVCISIGIPILTVTTSLFHVLDRVDGTRSIAGIATECGLSFEAVKGVIDELRAAGLAEVKT